MKTADPTVPAEAETCPVPEALQRRNAHIYAAMVALTYLTAPVLYVGMVQAALFKRLNISDALANLPSTLYLGMMWFPVLCAWWFPQTGMLRPLIRNAYLAQAVACGLVAGTLLLQAPLAVVIGVMLGHATVVGAANGTTVVLNWEMLGQAISTRMRAHALAWQCWARSPRSYCLTASCSRFRRRPGWSCRTHSTMQPCSASRP